MKITDCLIQNNIEKFKQDYGDNDNESFSDLEVKKNYSPGFLVQCAFLAGRNCEMTFRDGKTLGALFGQSIFISVFGGFLFWQLSSKYTLPVPEISPRDHLDETVYKNRIGSLFFILLNAYFPYLNYTGFRICNDNVIIFKEVRGQMYSTNSYYWAKSLSDMIIFCFPVIFSTIIGYYMTGMHQSWESFELLLLSCILLSILGGSLGLYAGTTSTDIKAVIQIMPLFFVPFILLGGFMINTGSLGWANFLGYISPIKYGMELIVRAEFENTLSTEDCDYLLWFFHYDLGVSTCVIVLLGIVVAFRLLAWWQINRISNR